MAIIINYTSLTGSIDFTLKWLYNQSTGNRDFNVKRIYMYLFICWGAAVVILSKTFLSASNRANQC